MPDKEQEILNLFTKNEILSNEIIDNHNKLFNKIRKYKDFDLEKILIELPYIDELKKYHLENIDILELNGLNPELIFMISYLFFRSALGELMTLNNLTQPITDKINSLFIDIFPSEIPDILRSGLFLQSKKSVLFDNVNRIVIYNENYNGQVGFRIFLFYTNGAFSNGFLLYSSILGKGIDEIDNVVLTGKFRDTDATLFRKALLFSIIFSILLKSENTPITLKDTDKSDSIKKLQPKKEKIRIEGWIERTIYLNAKYTTKNQLVKGTLYKDDKVLKDVIVSGYLRRKQNSKDEYIYIDSFASTRWVIEGNKKITYYLK